MRRALIVVLATTVLLQVVFTTGNRAQQLTPPRADGTPQTIDTVPTQDVVMRKGAKDMPKAELTTRAHRAFADPRYKALRHVANKHHLSFNKAEVKGLIFPDGNRAIFIPALDKQGHDSGFLASDGDSWTLSLLKQGGEVMKAYRVTNDKRGQAVVVEVPAAQENDLDEAHYAKIGGAVAGSTSCQYVSRYSISYGCWSPSDNPFGYYYTTVVRWGYTTDPRSPSWYACYRGSIHICPQRQTGMYSMAQCGFPPYHPQG